MLQNHSVTPMVHGTDVVYHRYHVTPTSDAQAWGFRLDAVEALDGVRWLRRPELGAALYPKPTMEGSWADLPIKHGSILKDCRWMFTRPATST